MQEIDKLREEIDRLHVEMASLFKRRLELTQEIWKIKKEQGLPFVDSSRENDLVHRFDSTTEDPEQQKALQAFMRSLLDETKKYLRVYFK